MYSVSIYISRTEAKEVRFTIPDFLYSTRTVRVSKSLLSFSKGEDFCGSSKLSPAVHCTRTRTVHVQ